MKESIKESAFGRRQELPAGTGAAPLCQPLKCGADYRDVTAALKMKRLRRLWGERLTFLAVAMLFRRRRRRERGLYLKFVLLKSRKPWLYLILFMLYYGLNPQSIAVFHEETISNAEVTDCDKNVLCRERHERVASRCRCGASVPSAGASHPWLSFNFCFVETKIKEKVFRSAEDGMTA